MNESIEQHLISELPISRARFAEVLKKAMKLYPHIKARYLGTDPVEKRAATQEGIQLFEAIDQELRRTCEALSVPSHEILAQVPHYLSVEDQMLLREAHALWNAYQQEMLKREAPPRPTHKRPRVSPLRIKI